jgi:hypothetical protein
MTAPAPRRRIMPQLKHEIPRFPVHLTCPHCLMPMHIRWAEVLNGQELVRFSCDYCGTEEQRDRGAR